jgi:Fe-S-cluster containining protein
MVLAMLRGEGNEHPDPEKGCIRRGLCCRQNPGWFGPGEMERAAELKGMDPDTFVRTYCIIDSTQVDGQTVHVFAPIKLGRDGEPLRTPGTLADRVYTMFPSPCVFFQIGDDGVGGCGIYGARPVECRKYICTNKPADNPTKEQVARLWLKGSSSEEEGADDG